MWDSGFMRRNRAIGDHQRVGKDQVDVSVDDQLHKKFNPGIEIFGKPDGTRLRVPAGANPPRDGPHDHVGFDAAERSRERTLERHDDDRVEAGVVEARDQKVEYLLCAAPVATVTEKEDACVRRQV